MIIDPVYFVFIIPPLLLSMWASFRTRSAFKRYSKVPTANGQTGAEAASRLLASAGLDKVRILRAQGVLSDHYNPANRTLNLSEGVYDSHSVAAVGVAAHEAGHAIQHAEHYKPLGLRSMLVPTAKIGSSLGYMVMLAGFFMSSAKIVMVGAVLFSAVLLFQVVTLPVEFDASKRAKELLVRHGIIAGSEREGVDRVLNAAALTYVAAAVSTLMTLLYFLFRAGLLGSRDD
jgi:Zn-dependent membrane protease YugP